MSVILPEAVWGAWFDPTIEDPSTVRTLLGSIESPDLSEHAVSTLVNKVPNNLPDLVKALETGAVED